MIPSASPCSEQETSFLSSSASSSSSSSAALMMMSPSCGAQERLHIHREVITDSSFSWNDFPVLVMEQERDCFYQHHVPHHVLCEPTLTAPTPPAAVAHQTDESEPEAPRSPSSTKQHRKKVSFSKCLEIRTHSVVLGNHPFCNALPLSLGWEYDDSELIDLDIYEQNKENRGNKATRLSFIERKLLLKVVAGMSEEELSQHDSLSGRSMRHSLGTNSLFALSADC